ENPALSARSMAAAIPVAQLKISEDQRRSIEAMYNPTSSSPSPAPLIIDNTFTVDPDSQLQACAALLQYGLDVNSLEDVGNRWSQQWSRKSADGCLETQRILY
ncbi:hypothetical protein B0H15DRAFT_758102, partial [Mycena belliarum]